MGYSLNKKGRDETQIQNKSWKKMEKS